MNLSTLKSLQSRIREATGADRELDFAICKTLGYAPQDAIWEVDENLPPELAKHYKRGWTTPAYVEHRREYKRGIDAAFAKTCSDAERAAEIKALDKEWDFKNSPPFGNVPNFTSDPDGLGACVGLINTVLPGTLWSVWDMEHGPGARLLCPGKSGAFHDGRYAEVDHLSDWTPASVCHALVDCAVSVLIAEEEAKLTEKAG